MWPHWPGIAFKATACFLHSLKSHLCYLNQYFKQIYWESNLLVMYQLWLPWLPPRTSIPTGYGPCPTSNINFKLNRPPDLTWLDRPTLTDRQLTRFEWHWPPDIWHLTPDNWFTTWERMIHTSSWKFQPRITMPGNSELAFLPSRRTCWRRF